jgi:hypothetical protein
MRARPDSKTKVEKWLEDEKVEGYVLNPANDGLEVAFSNIDDAFRFRLQFDNELV